MKIGKLQDIYLTFKGINHSRKIAKIENFTEEEIEKYQVSKIKSLLIKASREISFYKNLFWEINFDPYKFDNLDELKRIPILDKDTIRNNYSALISGLRSKNSIQLSTSGTSGERLTVYTSPSQWMIEQAAIWRQWTMAGYRFRDKMAIIRSYSPKKEEPLYKKDYLRNWLYISPYHLDEANSKVFLNLLKHWKPKFIRGYPSSIFLLSRYAEKFNIRLNSLRAIFTASEKLTKDHRQQIENSFGVKVFDHYGQAEITVMIHEWDDHSGLRNLNYYGYPEFIPTENNNIYKLIATNLHNDVMPLIRYDTGDLVEISNESKNSKKPNIKEIYGRSDDFLSHHNGYDMPSVNFYTYFSNIKEVKRFQFIETKSDLELRIQIDDDVDKSSLKNFINDEMLLRFGKKVKIKITNQFIQNHDGKLSAVVKI
tara:strand:- start:574 stop:1851 length:1278 start_codon:yes stop_codon:yes gene_type:complete